MTEAAPGTLFLRRRQRHARRARPGVRTSSAMSGWSGRTGAHADAGGAGRGPGPRARNVMPGYWRLPEETAAALRPTAGSAPATSRRVDDDGYVFIVDRIKDLIISGGENIYPAEVEDAAPTATRASPSAPSSVCRRARGARSAARSSCPARAPKLDPDEVIAFLSGRIAKYKIPKSVVVAETLPRTASGKVIKNLRRRATTAPDREMT